MEKYVPKVVGKNRWRNMFKDRRKNRCRKMEIYSKDCRKKQMQKYVAKIVGKNQMQKYVAKVSKRN
jgi:hypothetical protein